MNVLVYPRSRMSPQFGKVLLLELFILVQKTDGIMKNCSSSGFSILRNVSDPLTTIQSFYWTIMQATFSPIICNYCKGNGIIAFSIPSHTYSRLQPFILLFYCCTMHFDIYKVRTPTSALFIKLKERITTVKHNHIF